MTFVPTLNFNGKCREDRVFFVTASESAGEL